MKCTLMGMKHFPVSRWIIEPKSLKTVLVVDDCKDVRCSLALLLGIVGFRVAAASDGQEALDYLKTHPAPSVIVLDLRMPRMDGIRFRQEQVREPQLAAIPVIVSSGEADVSDSALRGAAFCPKPAEPFKLIQMIEAYCRN